MSTDTPTGTDVPRDSTRREIVTYVARNSPATMDALVTHLSNANAAGHLIDPTATREEISMGLHHRDLPILEQQGALVYAHRETPHWEGREIRATVATERIAARIHEQDDDGDAGVLIPDGGTVGWQQRALSLRVIDSVAWDGDERCQYWRGYPESEFCDNDAEHVLVLSSEHETVPVNILACTSCKANVPKATQTDGGSR